ncbi:hypothetical protein [Streptomyces sp. NPDC058297]
MTRPDTFFQPLGLEEFFSQSPFTTTSQSARHHLDSLSPIAIIRTPMGLA